MIDDVYRLNVQAGRRYRLVMTTLETIGGTASEIPSSLEHLFANVRVA